MRPIKIIFAICFVFITGIFVYSCSKGSNYGSSGGTVDPNTQYVTIQAMQFQPATVSVIPGMKITWTNMDNTAHTVTSDDGTSFNSGTINPGASYTFVAAALGSFLFQTEHGVDVSGY